MHGFPYVLLFACGSYCRCLIDCVAVHLLYNAFGSKGVYVRMYVCGCVAVTPMHASSMYVHASSLSRSTVAH